VIWWDIVLNRPALERFRTPYLPRWRRLAADFRALAVDMGGVLIKLGQFLSARVDLLPPEIVGELAGLQDEVPPVAIGLVTAQIEADFGRPVGAIFEWFSPEPVGSASLAQVHKARLATGERVAVKVLRPDIRRIVATDLKVIEKFLRRMRYFKKLRRYVDLDRLAAEFVAVTARELDLEREGLNAERFAANFADEPQVRVPKIYWGQSAAHTLTMEDVSYIKIDDFAALEAAGINATEVAAKLFDVYLEQISRTHFVHADPHAGNLFVRPLSPPDEALIYGRGRLDFRPGDPVPYYPDRPFQIVFVDFGMAVPIPKRLRASVRDYVIGVGTRDARLIVESYLDAGILLPDADLSRVEEMTEALLERFSGALLGQMKDVDVVEYAQLYAQYQTLLYTSPFQFQSDLLFVMRALGILSGMTAQLAPKFDPMAKIPPFTQRLLQDDWIPLPDRLAKLGPRLLKLPSRLEDVLARAQRGQLSVQTNLTPDALKAVERLRESVNRLAAIVLAVGLLVAGAIWHTAERVVSSVSETATGTSQVGTALMAAAAVVFLLALLARKTG
jgi:predicted unusual protein kinase regulating ubiquinone biosynthesis (AarF/ABC1/UbiB family)